MTEREEKWMPGPWKTAITWFCVFMFLLAMAWEMLKANEAGYERGIAQCPSARGETGEDTPSLIQGETE